MLNAWGKEAIFNLYRCNPYSIRSPARIADFTKTLVAAIDMKAYGAPQIIHFGTGPRGGYTLVQLIETSNITAHFAEEENKAFINVFSCKDFDVKVAEEVINNFFQPHNITSIVLERDAYPKTPADSTNTSFTDNKVNYLM